MQKPRIKFKKGYKNNYKENALALDEYLNKKAQELAYKKTNKQLIRKKQN